MSQTFDPHVIANARVVYTVPEMESVVIQRDIPFTGADGEPLLMDMYVPAGNAPARPVVLIVGGYPDAGVARIFGRPFKEMGSTVSWAQLIAASGLVAIAATNRAPEADLRALVAHLIAHGPALGIDAERLGLCASSANAALALSMLMSEGTRPRCAALLFPYLMDIGEDRTVATAAARFGFVNPAAGQAFSDLGTDVPLLLARAGQDQMPGLNQSLDRFVAAALDANLPVTVLNHPTGPHAADLFDPSQASRQIVRAALAFLQDHLTRERPAVF